MKRSKKFINRLVSKGDKKLEKTHSTSELRERVSKPQLVSILTSRRLYSLVPPQIRQQKAKKQSRMYIPPKDSMRVQEKNNLLRVFTLQELD
jgi:hypothetical protein